VKETREKCGNVEMWEKWGNDKMDQGLGNWKRKRESGRRGEWGRGKEENWRKKEKKIGKRGKGERYQVIGNWD
jgi:hypothetical protein